ncbi:MAG: 5,10-methylenetetrahydromethanopterin reductase [Candidatus Atabeyarchaeum deiterrae]|jgi:5,10-methylenetetrahydromethanopterin reductase
MKFGVELVPNNPIDEVLKWASVAEQKKFDYIWVTDHFNNRNTYVTLTSIALKTTSVRIGPGVTNPYLINPAWTASAMASLSEVSKGRAVLGIGAGDRTTLGYLGLEQKSPVAALAECVSIIRGLLKGDEVKLPGKVFNVSGARLSYQPDFVPIYLGVQGPKMLHLAAQISDGVLVNASDPAEISLAVREVRSGLDEASRPSSDFDIAAYTSFSVDTDPAIAMKLARPVVAFIAAASPDSVLERHGISPELIQTIRTALGKGQFKEAFKAVNDELLEVFSITGTPSQVTEKISAILKEGVSQLVIGSPIGVDKVKTLESVGSEIIPHFLQ